MLHAFPAVTHGGPHALPAAAGMAAFPGPAGGGFGILPDAAGVTRVRAQAFESHLGPRVDVGRTRGDQGSCLLARWAAACRQFR